MFMKLQKIQEIAIRQVDYYEQVNIDNEGRFPIVCKKDIQQNYSIFLTRNMDDNIREDILQQLNNRSIRCKISYNELNQIGEYIIEETTGTSGYPLRVVKSIEERTILGLNLYRCRKKVDEAFDANYFRAFNHTTLREENPKPYDFTENHIIRIYEELLRDKIRWLHTSIVPLKKHIKILNQAGMIEFPHLQFIELTGNYLKKEDIELVEDFFAAKVINMYGCMETWAIAYGIASEYMDICEDVVMVEIVNDEGNVIDEIGKEGDIIVTSLVCNTMPLIRYYLGDRGKVVMNNGRKKLVLLEGRYNQYIKGLEYNVLGTKQFGNILKMTLQKNNIHNISFIQFIQKEIDLIEIKVNDFNEKDIFLAALLSMIEERLNKKFRYEITIVDEKQIYSKENEKQELFICKV